MSAETMLGVRSVDLDAWSQHPWSDGLQLDTLQHLDELEIQTRNTTYHVTVISPQSGDVLVRGGRFFPTYTRARLAGSSLGGSFLKVRGIYVGFSLELHDGERSVVTTHIRSVIRLMNRDVH